MTSDKSSAKAIVLGLSSHHEVAAGAFKGDMSCHFGGSFGSKITGVGGLVGDVGADVGGVGPPISVKT